MHRCSEVHASIEKNESLKNIWRKLATRSKLVVVVTVKLFLDSATPILS